MGSPSKMAEVGNAGEAEGYLKSRLFAPGFSTDPRTLRSRVTELKEEFADSPPGVRKHVRDALLLCMCELGVEESGWHEGNGDDTPADDLLLFANDHEGVVDDENRGAVLASLQSVIDDMDNEIIDERSGLRDRCLQTIIGIMSVDEASREFAEAHGGQYSFNFWAENRPVDQALVAIERFHGPAAALDFAHIFARGEEGFRDMKTYLKVTVMASRRKEEWRALVEGMVKETEVRAVWDLSRAVVEAL